MEFELEDIEIIDHKNEDEKELGNWNCDQCSLFFLEKGKLDEHKKKHEEQEIVRCKYCKKTISSSEVNRECFLNRKCDTCEYKCEKCPQRFLRHSSLMNHEKKHASPKKKRAISNNKKVNGVRSKNKTVSKGVKRKRTETNDLKEQCTGPKIKKIFSIKKGYKKKQNSKVKAQVSLDVIENSPMKTPKHLSFKAIKSAGEENDGETLPVSPKRSTMKTNKLTEEKNVSVKYKQSTSAVNSQAVSPNANISSSENVVNYKPFSCHVCGDTFASDSALLNHIKTHGENAAKSFKCKFCSDEFDDVYQMQYHLAICPLAEDELESSLKQVIPIKIQTSFFGGTSSLRKRGRPKRLVESPSDQEYSKKESTTPSVKRGNFRKRKSEIHENNETSQTCTGSSLPKQSKKLQNNESVSEPYNRCAEENTNEPSSSDITEVTKENELNDDRKKLHHCPFPRCDFKFTREKALLCHMRNHSDDFEDSLKCHKCDIPFDDIQTLRQHINTCRGIKEEKDDDFNRADCYESSLNRTFQRTRKDFVCNQCGRSYQSQEKLNRCTHGDPQTKGYMVCRTCGMETEDGNKLKKHSMSSPHQCTACKAKFDFTSAEHEHRMATFKKGEQFTCVICPAKFSTYKDLYFHYSKDHVEQSQSICTICNITFSNYMALEEHNYVRHKSNDRFKCIFCHKAYSSSVSLTNHMKTHTTKIFKCKICYRPFTDTAILFQHMLFHASTPGTERPLKCAVCLAAYAKQSALKYHISGHISKNTSFFNCLICGETMTDFEFMTDHIFHHSIRITENNMTKNESEWIERIKGRKPGIKRGRPRLLSNHDSELKSNVRVENDESDFKQNIKSENEEIPIPKRGRGRPRIIKKESDETPGTKQVKRKPRKRSHDHNTAMEKSGRLTSPTNYDISLLFKGNRAGKKRASFSTKLKGSSRRTSLKGQINFKNNDAYDSDYEILEKNNSVSEKKPKKAIKANNNHLQIKGVTPKKVTVSSAKRGNRTDAVPQNHLLPVENDILNDIVETKVRPLSFKCFSSLTNTRALKIVNKAFKNDELTKEEQQHNEKFSLDNNDLLDAKEEMFDDDEEDPLGGIEIPYVSSRKGLRSSHRFLNGSHDWDCSLGDKKKEKSNIEDSNQFYDSESRNSDIFIKEEKYFEPSRGLTKYSCTTCLLSFPSQEELFYHNTNHVL